MHPFINIATKAALNAGKLIMRALDRLDEIEVTTKAKDNFVTSVDLACEEEIIQTLKKAYPDHAILGEESGLHGSQDNDYLWIIDPLDGTTNFINGYPHFCVSIALKYKTRIEHAVIYDPVTDNIYTASHGRGAQKNSRRIRVSSTSRLAKGIMGAVLPASQSHLRETFFESSKNVMSHCRTMRFAGAAALDLAYVSAGHLDGFWSVGLKPWDVAAASLIIREAGGIVTDFYGSDNYLETGNIIAGNPKLIKQLVEQLKPLAASLKK